MAEFQASVLERLIATNPDMEIWWDSSPLVHEKWVQSMVKSAPPEKRERWEAELRRTYNAQDPVKSNCRGCTTNPPLSLTAVKSDPDKWNEWIDAQIEANPGIDAHSLFWITYKEVIRRGAAMFYPIWEASNGKYGYVSGQLDPRLLTEVDRMVTDAQELRTIAPNVMIKVPASTQGVEVVRTLTSMAIPTNVTTCFCLPQIWAVANAAKEGYEIGLKNGVDMSKWRAVITQMIGRLTEHPVLDEQAARRNIKLSWADKHWFGIWTFRTAYRLLKDGGYPSKMLACSMRDGPIVAGKKRFWDVEKIAGGDIVYTMPPYVLEPLWKLDDDYTFKPEIDNDDVPKDVIAKLMQIPFARQASDINGLEVDQFNTFPSTVATAELFSKASAGLEEWCANRIAVVTGKKVETAAAGKN